MSVMIQKCIEYKEKESRLLEDDIHLRAQKMPQSEFERVVAEFTTEHGIDFSKVAKHFGVAESVAIKRGEDLHMM